jgi:MFS family permease
MRSNIRLFYAYIFLNRLEMWLPIVVLFVQDRGFSLAQYTALDAVWYVSTLVFEVPTGVVTDRYGKKVSLLVAAALQSFSLFILAIAKTFLLMIISYVLWGLASSFETGTTDAFVYDSLKQINREEDYGRVRGRITTLTLLAAALGSVLAGYLAGIRLALPIILTASIALLLCPIILFFREPAVSDVREPSHLLHIRESIRYVSYHRLVALLIVYSSILATAVWGLHDFYQPLLRSFGIPVERIGLLYLLFRLSGMVGARLSDPVYKVMGSFSIYLIPLCFVAAVFCMGFLITPWVIVCVFVIYFTEGFYYPIANTLLNKNLPSGKRATIISIGSVLSCLMGAVLYPSLGKIADVFSLQMTFKALGWGFLICMALTLAFLRREAT